MFITDTQTRDGMAVYWFGDAETLHQYGVCFEDGYFNIARQSLAESLCLANEVLTDAVEEMGEKKP